MEEAEEMKEKGVVQDWTVIVESFFCVFFVFLLVFLGVVQDWTVIVEGFLLFPVCLAGFLLNIVRWPVTLPHQAASLTKTLLNITDFSSITDMLTYEEKKHFFVAAGNFTMGLSPPQYSYVTLNPFTEHWFCKSWLSLEVEEGGKTTQDVKLFCFLVNPCC